MNNETGDHSFFVIRIASSPISAFIHQLNQIQNSGNNDYDTLLNRWLMSSWNQKGLFLASPSLFNAWQTNPQSESLPSPIRKALWQYMIRTYCRATPFGLFSGVGVGRVEQSNQIDFGDQPWEPVSRPDSILLETLTRSSGMDKSVRSQLRYWLNNSVYCIADEYRFSQLIQTKTESKIVLSSFTVSAELKELIHHLKQQETLSYTDLLSVFGQEDSAAVEQFINQLIDAQFLSSSLLMPITGQSWPNRLIRLNSDQGVNNALLTQFQSINDSIPNKQDTITELIELQSRLESLYATGQPETVESVGSLIQTDLVFKPTQLSLSRELINCIASQYAQLLPVLANADNTPLKSFIQRFRERYQDETIPLLSALDPEYGISFSAKNGIESPVLAKLPFSKPIELTPTIQTKELAKLLYERFLLSGEREINLTDDDLKPYQQNSKQATYPINGFLFGSLYWDNGTTNSMPENHSAPMNENRKWLFSARPVDTSTSAFLLGRFCLNDQVLSDYVQRMCAWEQTQFPQDILAEVVHAPPIPKRARNVMSRPTLRAFELPYLTPSGLKADKVIQLTDILLRVTETGDIQLISSLTGQRIRPRLSTAHNVSLGDDIYQFLGYVEKLEYKQYGWQWGTLIDQPSLPRITYRNLILQTARWTIRKETVLSMQPITVDKLRSLYQLPRYVQLSEEDYALFLDLDSPPCQSILLEEFEKNERIHLKEWLSGSYQPWVNNQGESYVSELIIPLKVIDVPDAGRLPNNPAPDRLRVDIQRNVFPGHSWLYYKIYLSELAADHYLANRLPDFVDSLLEKRWCYQFFFVRYYDPGFHLRIRFLSNPTYYTELVDACNVFFTPTPDKPGIYRFQMDTYQRELERYNPELMCECESLFNQDSLMVLNYLASGHGEAQSDMDRYSFALGSIDSLLDDFSLSPEEKVALYQQSQYAYWKEEGNSKVLKKELNTLYRLQGALLFEQAQLHNAYFLQRSKDLKSIVGKINQFYAESNGTTPRSTLITSLIHLNLNRLFPTQQRQHEYIVYHFLARRYESILARIT